jgi:hypothetical protein
MQTQRRSHVKWIQALAQGLCLIAALLFLIPDIAAGSWTECVGWDLENLLEGYQNKELEQFFAAKTHVFKRDWTKARAGLQKYLKDYPQGRMQDEALYWLGMSFNRLSREEKSLQTVVQLKESAIRKLETLIHDFSQSLWIDDAKTLRVEIAGELFLLGQTEYDKYVQEAVQQDSKTQSELKLVALNSLVRMETETVIPTLIDILSNDEDPVVRKQCVRLLGSHFGLEVVEALQKAAREDPNAAVRAEAEYWIAKIHVRLIPVELSYYAFETWAKDSSLYAQTPEHKLIRFTLAHGKPGAGRARVAISQFFKDKVKGFGSTGSQRGVSRMYTTQDPGNTSTRISHRINNFQVHVVGGSIQKSADRISGQVSFQDRESGRNYTESFEVNVRQDVLFAMRRGDQLAVMLLQFENWPSLEEASGEAEAADWGEAMSAPLRILSKIFGVKNKPVYYTQYSNWMGCKVDTTLQSSGLSDLQGDKFDFSLSRATILGPGGSWQLTGYLIGRKDKSQFLGRMATLVDPSGKVVAVADELTVSISDPSQFEVTGSRLDSPEVQSVLKEEEPSQPFAGPGEVSLQGCRIFIAKKIADMKAAVIDLGEARAEIPVKGQVWILTGHLILIQSSRNIVAADAQLLAPDGHEATRQDLILVPIDSPAQFRSLDKEKADILNHITS